MLIILKKNRSDAQEINKEVNKLNKEVNELNNNKEAKHIILDGNNKYTLIVSIYKNNKFDIGRFDSSEIDRLIKNGFKFYEANVYSNYSMGSYGKLTSYTINNGEYIINVDEHDFELINGDIKTKSTISYRGIPELVNGYSEDADIYNSRRKIPVRDDYYLYDKILGNENSCTIVQVNILDNSEYDDDMYLRRYTHFKVGIDVPNKTKERKHYKIIGNSKRVGILTVYDDYTFDISSFDTAEVDNAISDGMLKLEDVNVHHFNKVGGDIKIIHPDKVRYSMRVGIYITTLSNGISLLKPFGACVTLDIDGKQKYNVVTNRTIQELVNDSNYVRRIEIEPYTTKHSSEYYVVGKILKDTKIVGYRIMRVLEGKQIRFNNVGIDKLEDSSWRFLRNATLGKSFGNISLKGRECSITDLPVLTMKSNNQFKLDIELNKKINLYKDEVYAVFSEVGSNIYMSIMHSGKLLAENILFHK